MMPVDARMSLMVPIGNPWRLVQCPHCPAADGGVQDGAATAGSLYGCRYVSDDVFPGSETKRSAVSS